MQFKTFFSQLKPEERERFAARCGTSRFHLQNVMYGKPCATDLAVNIERESKRQVRRWDLRPDDWFKHWPELIGRKGAPQIPTEEAA